MQRRKKQAGRKEGREVNERNERKDMGDEEVGRGNYQGRE